jgi:hypothetical protein
MHTSIPSLVGFAKIPWNKARLTGQKRPLRPREVWAIRVRLQNARSRASGPLKIVTSTPPSSSSHSTRQLPG